MKKLLTIGADTLRSGSQFIEVHDTKDKVVAVIRIALLHLGVDGKNLVEIRTEVPSGSSQLRAELK